MLAIFDLDNTLIAGDSDYLWGRFLVEQGVVDAEGYERENQRFYDAYRAGTLDIYSFLRFSLRPLAMHDPARLRAWREAFFAEKIRPILLPAAQALIERHRREGHTLLIITATNRFVVEPIVAAFGIDELLATDPEMIDGRYTGEVAGVPCFRDGKVLRLRQWLAQRGETLGESWFYSDSHNDLPLLDLVARPTAVDPDDTLAHYARVKGWPIITLRG